MNWRFRMNLLYKRHSNNTVLCIVDLPIHNYCTLDQQVYEHTLCRGILVQVCSTICNIFMNLHKDATKEFEIYN